MGFSEPFFKCLKQLKNCKKIEYAMYIVCGIVAGVFAFLVADDSRFQAIGINVLFLFIPVIIAFVVAKFCIFLYWFATLFFGAEYFGLSGVIGLDTFL